jgi:hypothetical protein
MVKAVDLREHGIDESQAADLRRRLAPFAEDWDRPEMAAYDDLPCGDVVLVFVSGFQPANHNASGTRAE